MIPLTHGTLLGGRVPYAQPQSGYYRTGIEPVFLAAAIPVQPGQRVLEGGTGAGAGLLCLLAREPGATAIGIERDPDMAAIARLNARNLPLTIHTADIATAPEHAPIHHAFANPPWHHPAATPSPNPGRRLATHLPTPTLSPWITAMAAALTQDGTLTLALPPPLVDQSLDLAAQSGLSHVTIFPLWPKPGRPPKIILIQCRRGPPTRVDAPGLTLHTTTGGYTEAAEAILREGRALRLNPAA